MTSELKAVVEKLAEKWGKESALPSESHWNDSKWQAGREIRQALAALPAQVEPMLPHWLVERMLATQRKAVLEEAVELYQCFNVRSDPWKPAEFVDALHALAATEPAAQPPAKEK